MQEHTMEHSFCSLRLKDIAEGAEEMAQWLRAFACLAEDLGLVASTHTVAHNHP